MLRVLTLSTLFPDASRPNFGVFVERQTLGLAAHPDVALKVVAPIGLPPFPLDRHPRYRTLAAQPYHEYRKGLEIYRPRFLNIPGTQGRRHAAMLTRALVRLLDGIREDFPFDILDTEFFFPDGPAAIALGKRYGVPVSIKARGADIHHWGTAVATRDQVLAAGKEAAGTLAVSAAMADDMAALGMPRDRIRVHHTGIDRTRFGTITRAQAKAGLNIRGSLILSVGALIPRKGHDIVIAAMADLPSAHLWVVGAGPEETRLRAQAERIGVARRVRFTGAIPHDELPPIFAAADVMALASASEGLANVWVEALASGTPLVIPDAGGAKEVVSSMGAGRIVERSPQAFAMAIRQLLTAPPATEWVKAMADRFSWDRNRDTLYAHLSALVANQSSG